MKEQDSKYHNISEQNLILEYKEYAFKSLTFTQIQINITNLGETISSFYLELKNKGCGDIITMDIIDSLEKGTTHPLVLDVSDSVERSHEKDYELIATFLDKNNMQQ
ncbi:hypothetical protein OA92_10105 [Marinomonas sp. SBI22]|uniref:hypothetical protein n=1 Tax=unclassified Marinomonas TaxID=196814 RepID=UPI0007AF5E79|nr:MULTISPECIES: hypothetical protein [unclassified Marinomonas]KZM43099.1 hypothetical protein OA92_10105 [Marinomonas sp. SBI22]KZM44670.1 hypothetical protein OA91_09530 [Marinomonas sp. SBI8L]